MFMATQDFQRFIKGSTGPLGPFLLTDMVGWWSTRPTEWRRREGEINFHH